MNILRAIAQAWQRSRARAEFLDGCEYASDLLIASKATPDELVQTASIFEEYEEFAHFSRGIRHAVGQFRTALAQGQGEGT